MGARWFITGATGRLGTPLRRALEASGAQVIATSKSGAGGSEALDLHCSRSVIAALSRLMPSHVLHLGGVSRPIDVARQPDIAHRVNVVATRAIADWCADHGRTLLFTSTDQVFSGAGAPFREEHEAAPATMYGEMKRDAEAAVLAAGGIVARCGWLINDYPDAAPDMVTLAMQQLGAGRSFYAVDDEWRTPIGTSLAASILLRLAARGTPGIVHVAGRRHCRPIDLVRQQAERLNLPEELVRPVSRLALGVDNRPADVRLNTDRLHSILQLGPNDTSLAA